MIKDQQEIAWVCLPKDARNQIISSYFCKRESDTEYNKGYVDAMLHIYGIHNLTSDTEPEEMLMVERNFIIDFYKRTKSRRWEYEDARLIRAMEKEDGKFLAIEYLFGDKCQPDKEQPKPKFSLNEIVRVTSDDKYGTVGRIIKVDEEDDGFFYTLNGVKDWRFVEKNLEPYTEENKEIEECPYTDGRTCDTCMGKGCECEYKPKETMEAKELNLCELLKGCEGEEFYSLMHGKVRFMTIGADGFVMFDLPESFSVYDNGKYDLNAEVIIYPSRALYEKYPLDAYSAWMEWKESRMSNYEIKVSYQIIGNSQDDEVGQFNTIRCNSLEEAKQVAKAVKETLDKFHKIASIN